jgi:hypothetical protein
MARTKGSKSVSRQAPAPKVGAVSKRGEEAPERDLNALESELKARVEHLNTLLPGETPPSETLVRAIFAYSGELLELAREVASRAETQTQADEETPAPDFSFMTYEQFQEKLAEADTLAEKPLPTAAGQEFLVLVVKTVLTAAGIEAEYVSVVMAVLEELAKGETQEMIGHVRNKRWSQAATSLRKLLDVMRSSAFRTRLARRIGAKAAARLVAKIASRFVPFVGPALFISSVIWQLARMVV